MDMNSRSMTEVLQEAIIEYLDPAMGFEGALTFEEAGILTNDQGLEVKVGGCTFQITVVRSN